MRTTWQRALVTGASAGIGEAITRRLAAAGTDLVLVARDKARLDALADELRDRHGIDADVLPADLGDPAQLALVERRVGADKDPVDLLVNNAGFGAAGRFDVIPVDRQDAMVQLNVVALLRLSHAALVRMRAAPAPTDRRRPRGGILQMSSMASFVPAPTGATYAATKAFVTSLGSALHEEASSDGIVVTTVCPGYTHTEFHERGEIDLSDLPEKMWLSAEHVARVALDALDRRRALVVPGMAYKSTQVWTRLMPQSVVRKFMAASVRGRPGV